VASELKLAAGTLVRITQGGFSVNASLVIDDSVSDGAVCIPFGTEVSAALGDARGPVTLEAV
jgi:hypothetical protein